VSSPAESAMRWAMIVGATTTSGGTCRLGVQLPQRPNGRVGWIDARFVRVSWSPWRIEVNRSSDRAQLLHDGHPVRTFSVDVGTRATPTPAGLFAVLYAVPSDPGASFGAWILGLSAESNALFSFDGGPGRIGLHGRDRASDAKPLGVLGSHGCVRFTNEAIRWIVAQVGAPNLPGVAVEIR
jgi:hypothetical protein